MQHKVRDATFIKLKRFTILMTEDKATTLIRIYKEDLLQFKVVQSVMSVEEKKALNQEDVMKVLIGDFLKEMDSKSKATTPDTLEVPV